MSKMNKNIVTKNFSFIVTTPSNFPFIAPTATTLLNAITDAPMMIKIAPIPIFSPPMFL